METITDLGLFVFWLGTLLVWLAAWVHMSSLGNRIREVECDTDRLVSSQNTLRSSLKSDLVDVRNSADGRYETVTDYLQANKDRIEHLKQTIQAIYIRLDKLDKVRVEDKENIRAAIELYRTNVNERIDKVGQQMINTNVHMDKVHNQQSSVIERVFDLEKWQTEVKAVGADLSSKDPDWLESQTVTMQQIAKVLGVDFQQEETSP